MDWSRIYFAFGFSGILPRCIGPKRCRAGSLVVLIWIDTFDMGDFVMGGFLAFVFFVVYVILVVYIISLFIRLVRAVERVADKYCMQSDSSTGSGGH
jgi:hypothetical protein